MRSSHGRARLRCGLSGSGSWARMQPLMAVLGWMLGLGSRLLLLLLLKTALRFPSLSTMPLSCARQGITGGMGALGLAVRVGLPLLLALMVL